MQMKEETEFSIDYLNILSIEFVFRILSWQDEIVSNHAIYPTNESNSEWIQSIE